MAFFVLLCFFAHWRHRRMRARRSSFAWRGDPYHDKAGDEPPGAANPFPLSVEPIAPPPSLAIVVARDQWCLPWGAGSAAYGKVSASEFVDGR